MKYGYFDDANREYVITNPKTPVKWINYVGTLAFGGLVDHTGGALICKGDPALNRITKYLPQLPDSDFKGETLYLRLREKEGYKIFSPFFVPTLDPYELYSCHIGLGYTRIVSSFYKILTEVTIFVPINGTQVIRDIRITNVSDSPIEIDVIPVVEYTHFDALKQFTNVDWVPQTMMSQVIELEEDRKILLQYAFMQRDRHMNYLTSNLPVASFETDRKQFLGNDGYGTWAKPFSLQQPELNNSVTLRGDNIGALLHHLGPLKAGESRRLITQLGQLETVQSALPMIHRYMDEREVDAAFAELKTYWQEYLLAIQVETPNTSMNSMLNIHHPRQCHSTKNWSRYLSLYQLGLGARSMGFRDSAQDVLGVLAHMPHEGRDLIVKLLHTQKRNGSAMHQFNPLTMIANEGEAGEDEGIPDYYSDDHLWIILATCTYIKETGDFAFLDQVIPYYEKDKHNIPLESGTVYDHLKRAIEFTRHNVGKHGLPLLGFADWNDTVNLRAGAESVFTANLYGLALREMMDLAAYRQETELVQRYQTYYDDMRETVNACAWDGAWYIRYFDWDGKPLGSQSNDKGQIYVNAQSWSVMSGFASQDRARQALNAVREKLNTKNGIKLSAPGYNGYDPNVGGISTYPPGAKENGGIFLHANPWVMIAETMLGNGDWAFEYYDQINPAAKNDKLDEYECEPYVYAQNILGDEHPQFGLARNSWLSGTAAWTYRAATQHILGMMPTYAGLKINPCIPATWDGFKVTRRYRGATYHITIQNPDHVCTGIKSVTVNGEMLSDNVLSCAEAGQEVHVVVVMGA